MLVQLSEVFMSDNKLEGSLPETWGNLINVSFAFVVTALAI